MKKARLVRSTDNRPIICRTWRASTAFGRRRGQVFLHQARDRHRFLVRYAALELDAAAFADPLASVRTRVLRTIVKRWRIDRDDAIDMCAWALDDGFSVDGLAFV